MEEEDKLEVFSWDLPQLEAFAAFRTSMFQVGYLFLYENQIYKIAQVFFPRYSSGSSEFSYGCWKVSETVKSPGGPNKNWPTAAYGLEDSSLLRSKKEIAPEILIPARAGSPADKKSDKTAFLFTEPVIRNCVPVATIEDDDNIPY